MEFVLVHHVRLLPERPSSVEEFRVTVIEGLVLHRPGDLVEELLRLDVEGLAAVHAEVEFPRRVLATPGAGDGGEVLRLLGLDLLTVGTSVSLLEALVSEVGHVPSSVVGPTLPALSVLDLGLAQVSCDQPARVRLPEVGRSDLLLDADTVGSVLEVVEPGVVARPFGRRELAPERSRVVIRSGMITEPPLDVRRRDDQVDASLTLLAVDVDPECVGAVEDVAHSEVEELAATESPLELEGDQRGVAGVERAVDHRFDLLFPPEEVPLARDGVEVVRGPRRDPLQGLRRLVELQAVRPERPQRSPEVLVRVLVGVLAVDPADDRLGRRSVLQRRPEEALLLEQGIDVVIARDAGFVGLVVVGEVLGLGRRGEGGHPAAVPEQLDVAVFPDLRGDEPDVVAHLQQVPVVGVVLNVGFPALELRSERVGLLPRVDVSHGSEDGVMDCKVGADFRPLAYTLSLTFQESEAIRSISDPTASSGDAAVQTGVSA